MVICSYVSHKNAVSKIRVENPYQTLEEFDPRVFYYDIPGVPPAAGTLSSTDVFVFRGPAKPGVLEFVRWARAAYPKLKFVLDNDDLLWNGEIPEWNAHRNIPFDQKTTEAWMRSMDVLTFSTNYLRKYVVENFGVDHRRTLVVPNAVKKSEWFRESAERPKVDGKPRVLYMGSPVHYSNEKKMLGDWTEGWVEWVFKAVESDEIEFVCIGGVPWFFEPLVGKIRSYGWIPYSRLPGTIREIHPHVCINPLKENKFNTAKSDLKLVECAASGMVCVGTDFPGSPYAECKVKVGSSASAEEIGEAVFGSLETKTFRKIVKSQFDWIESEGRWLESEKHLDLLRKSVGLKT